MADAAQWMVDDLVASIVAVAVYKELESDAHQAANALHAAIQKLFPTRDDPRLWAPFVHSGP